MYKISKVKHEDVMAILDEVPGVKEFMESFSVQMAQAIMDRRIDLGWTQERLAQEVRRITGESTPQSTISRIEGGASGIRAETYDKVLRALGFTGLTLTFGADPKVEKEGEVQIKSGTGTFGK